MRKLKRHLTYANVTATLALILAAGGGATAVALTAAKNSVTAKSIRNGNVTAKELAGVRLVSNSASGGVLTASCGANEKLIGGGANQDGDPQARFLGSYPDGNAWIGSTLAGPAPSSRLTVYALCLKARPGRR